MGYLVLSPFVPFNKLESKNVSVRYFLLIIITYRVRLFHFYFQGSLVQNKMETLKIARSIRKLQQGRIIQILIEA